MDIEQLIRRWAEAVHTGDELADVPERRLRLTLGLVERDGRWVVTHEHRSFADTSVSS
jgi:ketosteroid isomerase-like protein